MGNAIKDCNLDLSTIEIIRYCINDDKLVKKLYEVIKDSISEADFKIFKKSYPGLPKESLMNYLNSYQSSMVATKKSQQFHSNIRRLLSIKKPKELREYQNECSNLIQSKLQDSNDNILLVLPTGGGKTKVALDAIINYIDNSEKPLNILWMVHSVPLCNQAEEAIISSWQEPRLGGKNQKLWLNKLNEGAQKLSNIQFDDFSSFTVATPDTFKDNLEMDKDFTPFDLIVCDEAHHGIAEQERVYSKIGHKQILGLTATPELNKDNVKFNNRYTKMLVPKNYLSKHGKKPKISTISQDMKSILVNEKFLSTETIVKFYAAHEADVLDLTFESSKPWQKQPSSSIILAELAKKMYEENNCKRILVFCQEIDQARLCAGILRDKGISAAAIYSGLKRIERNSRLDGLSTEHFNVLISVDILREGVDIPLVDGIIVFRRNVSEESDPMFTQIIGRGLRGLRSGGTEKCLVWHVV
jgi:superfamily II DNA or RNA helicase